MEKVKNHLMTLGIVFAIIIIGVLFIYLITYHAELVIVGLVVGGIGYFAYQMYSGILQEVQNRRK